MSDFSATQIADLVACLESRGVEFLSVRQGDDILELTLAASVENMRPSPSKETVLTAQGPGKFWHSHPASRADLPCLEAGDFLFPLASRLQPHCAVLAPNGAIVGYGTPLLRDTV